MPKAKKKKTVKSKPKEKKVSKTKKVSKPKKAKKEKNVNSKVLVSPAEEVEEIEIIEIDTEEKPDRYEEHACGFVNESDCEEDLEEDGLDIEDVEKNHFDQDENE
jgi:hypothetical protein